MPSESSTVSEVVVHLDHYHHHLPSISTITREKARGSATAHNHSSTSGSSTIMSLVSSAGSQITATDSVGLTVVAGTLPGVGAQGSTNKRGRKPGPLSKSAREAQRRLNHSIIEKARRTKINDALATLKQLVPVDYLQTREMQRPVAVGNGDEINEINEEDCEDEDQEDDDEGGDEEGLEDDSEYRERTYSHRTLISATTKQSSSDSKITSKGGKKQEKEKEFKLEILVRTVVFLQDLLERVSQLEAAVPSSKSSSNSATAPQHGTTCGNGMTSTSSTTTITSNKKRKREYSSPTVDKDIDDVPPHGPSRSRTKVPRTASSPPDLEESPPTPRFSPHGPQGEKHVTATGTQSPKSTAPSSPSSSSASSADKRLPSISSWLNSGNDPHILPSPLSFGTFVGTVADKERKNRLVYTPRSTTSTSSAPLGSPSYLPSPPSSTHCFDPIKTYSSTQVPPFLNLGPGVTSNSPSCTSVGSGSGSPVTSKSLGKLPMSTSRASSTAQTPSSAPPTPLVLTPEDESAASMLLQIASSSSPQFRPINPPSSSTSSYSASSRTTSTTTSPNFPGYHNSKNVNALPEPTHFSLYSSHPPHRIRPHPRQFRSGGQRSQSPYDDRLPVRQVETPSSILGIRKY